MNIRIVSIIAALGLGACAGGTAAMGPAPLEPSSDGTAMRYAGDPLLYVSDPGSGLVSMLRLSDGKLLHAFSGFVKPQGACTDLYSNVYVADAGAAQFVKFRHGKQQPEGTIDDPTMQPLTCAANVFDNGRTNGWLAAVNSPTASEPPSVRIYYTNGSRRTYRFRNMTALSSATFKDNTRSSQLVVEGANGAVEFKELHGGRRRWFRSLPMREVPAAAGPVGWFNRHIVAADPTGPNNTTVVYTYLGSRLAKKTSLSARIAQFCTYGDLFIGSVPSDGAVEIWKFPHGGKPIQTFTGFTAPFGVAVSP